MRWIIWKIFLPVVLVALDALFLMKLGADKKEVLKELGSLAGWLHFPLGHAVPFWVTQLSTTPFRQGWLLLMPFLLNTMGLGFLLGAWFDWRLEERSRGRHGVVDSLMRNFGEPRGLLGRITAGLMNRGNRRLNRYCVEALQLQPEDHVLDVGFGGGASFEMVLAKLGVGSLSGVDSSETMVLRARRGFSRQARSGRLELVRGSVDHLPFENALFDKALTANTIYFWPDLLAGLKEIRRVLRLGGVLALGMRPQEVMGRFRDFGFRAYSEKQVLAALYKAGFNKIEVEDRPDGKLGAKVFLAQFNDLEVKRGVPCEGSDDILDATEKNVGTLLDVET